MSSPDDQSRRTRAGLAYGLLAYGWWGIVPLYFKAVAHVPPPVVLAHRVVWSVVFLSIVIAAQRRGSEVLAVVRDRRTMLTLIGSTVMVSINWLLFIYAISINQVLQSSLGYFINPLLFVAMAVVLLKERLRAAQIVAIVVAATGVLYLTARGEGVPWLALGMAGSFAVYGLLRKVAKVSPVVGLMVETLLLFIPAVIVAGWYAAHDGAAAATNSRTYGLLVFGGIITTVPLLAFAAATQRLPLATMGFLQYIAPTGQFLLAVFLYDERFTAAHAISFGCIWTGLVIFSISSFRGYRARGVARNDEDAAAPVTVLPE